MSKLERVDDSYPSSAFSPVFFSEKQRTPVMHCSRQDEPRLFKTSWKAGMGPGVFGTKHAGIYSTLTQGFPSQRDHFGSTSTKNVGD